MDSKTTIESKWPASRIVHLAGGGRAFNIEGPMVVIHPPGLGGNPIQFSVRSYGSIYKEIEDLGLKIIGVDFITHVLELKGLFPLHWRSYHRHKGRSWATFDATQTWSNIGNAAFRRKDGVLWDLASRISYQLRASDLRLHQTSESYYNQLDKVIKRSDFEVGTVFMDGFTLCLFMSIHAFLIDACILRDCLAEFAAKYIVLSQGDKGPKITTMAGLKKYITKLGDNSGTPLLEKLIKYTDKGGWIHGLGCYRDLVIHSSPLVLARQKLAVRCDAFQMKGGIEIPAIACPIPEKPAEIMASRTAGTHFDDFNKQFEAYIDIRSLTLDGLTYLHDLLGNITILALEIAQYSPVKPEIMTFTDKDIKDFKEIKYD